VAQAGNSHPTNRQYKETGGKDESVKLFPQQEIGYRQGHANPEKYCELLYSGITFVRFADLVAYDLVTSFGFAVLQGGMSNRNINLDSTNQFH
jgi:hypothetical protein